MLWYLQSFLFWFHNSCSKLKPVSKWKDSFSHNAHIKGENTFFSGSPMQILSYYSSSVCIKISSSFKVPVIQLFLVSPHLLIWSLSQVSGLWITAVPSRPKWPKQHPSLSSLLPSPTPLTTSTRLQPTVLMANTDLTIMQNCSTMEITYTTTLLSGHHLPSSQFSYSDFVCPLTSERPQVSACPAFPSRLLALNYLNWTTCSST